MFLLYITCLYIRFGLDRPFKGKQGGKPCFFYVILHVQKGGNMAIINKSGQPVSVECSSDIEQVEQVIKTLGDVLIFCSYAIYEGVDILRYIKPYEGEEITRETTAIYASTLLSLLKKQNNKF